MKEIKCPHDLNQFLLGEPIFENTFPEEECEMHKYYGDCFHCFATAIASRDKQLKGTEREKGVLEQLSEKQNSLSATVKAWDDYIDKHGAIY